MGSDHIKAIVLDVDGVLTDGRLFYDAAGEHLKVFYVQDGSAIKAWLQAGGKMAWLSGRDHPAVRTRAAELGVSDVVLGRDDKLGPFNELLSSWNLEALQVCYVGDDEPDVPPMQACGLAVAVGNAVTRVKQQANYVTQAAGGAGAVREVIEYLMGDNR